MLIDLHVHTNASDGLHSPAEIVGMAEKSGVTVLGIADHDTVNGIDEAGEAAVKEGITIVPAVEINSYDGDTEYHILGYFINYDSEELRCLLADLREARVRRMHVILSKLRTLGIAVEPVEILSLSGGGAVGRPHIAQVLVNRGFARSVREAFASYIGEGKPAYAPRSKLTPDEAISIIHRAGGAAVLAHPGLWGADRHISRLASLGIAGIEAFSPSHSPGQTVRYLEIAHSLGLCVTGGSDFHGWSDSGRNALASSVTPPEEFARLQLLAKKR